MIGFLLWSVVFALIMTHYFLFQKFESLLYVFSALGWQNDDVWSNYNDDHSFFAYHNVKGNALKRTWFPSAVPYTGRLNSARMDFFPQLTLPTNGNDWSIIANYVDWSTEEQERLDDLVWALNMLNDDYYDYSRVHQLLGYPRPIQNNPVKPHEQLLLQIDSDYDEVGFMWGDGGMIYFTIPEEALSGGEITDISIDFQCY
jgi:hypothetical protein